MKTIKVSSEMSAAIANVIADGKTPWVAVKDGAVVEVYISRANARASKDGGKIMKASDIAVEVEPAPTADQIADQFDAKLAEVSAQAAAPVSPAVVETAFPSAEPKGKKAAKKIEITRHSSIEKPCKRVWWIADEMKEAAGGLEKLRRKDVLARCVAEGIAYYTARTQYQLWLTIQNGGSI